MSRFDLNSMSTTGIVGPQFPVLIELCRPGRYQCLDKHEHALFEWMVFARWRIAGKSLRSVHNEIEHSKLPTFYSVNNVEHAGINCTLSE
jgi:hypothetical protein